MKSKALAAQIRDSKLCHSASSLGALVDINVAGLLELPGLHMQVAIGQTGGLFHLHESHWQARYEGGQDAKTTRGANHLVDLKLHGVIYFVLRSICPDSGPVKG